MLTDSWAAMLLLIGTAAERAGLNQRLRPNNRKCRAYSRVFLARLRLTLAHCRERVAALADPYTLRRLALAPGIADDPTIPS